MIENKMRWAAGCVAAAMMSAAGLVAAGGTDTNLAKLPKEVQAMHCLVGDWRGDATFKQGETKTPIQVQMNCKPTSGGYAISCETRFKNFPGGEHVETDLFGYDASQKKYHWFAVNGSGDSHDHVSDPPTRGTLDWNYESQRDGKPFHEHIKMTIAEDHKRLEVQSEGLVGGVFAFGISGAVTKK